LPGERATVHLAVARAISDHPSLVPSGRSWSDLAMHWQLAGEPRRALAAAATACREARSLGALAEAARHGSRALELWDAVPDAEQVTGLDRVDLLLQLAEDSLLGGGTPAHTWTRHALDLLDASGDPARHAIVTARLARYELMAGHDTRRVLDTAARATAEAAASTDLRAQALVALDHAQILMHCDSYGMSRDHASAALQRAVELGDRVMEVHARVVLATDSCSVGDWRVSMSEFDRAERLSAQLAGPGAGEARARAALSHAVCLLWLGFPERAFERAVAAAERSSTEGLDLSLGSSLRAAAAAAAVTSGRLDTAERLLDEIPRPALQRYAQFRIEARHMLGLARGVLDTVDGVVPYARHDQQAPIWLFSTALAEAALALGQPERAREEVARLLSFAVEHGMVLEVPRLVTLGTAAEAQAADIARASRDAEALARCCSRAAQLLGVGERTADVVRECAATLPPDAIVWRSISDGWSARLEGRPEHEAWDRAVAASEAAGMPLLGVQARIEAARCRLRAGDRAAAAEILVVALATATRCGANGLAAAASGLVERARLGTVAAERLDGRTTGERLGLTDREIQVLRLVADGRTNREIGEALYMSPKTASVHVTALLRKLEVPGRRDAARRARQLGLA
jgi:DNA-binding NarL/FixJ family response regulator